MFFIQCLADSEAASFCYWKRSPKDPAAWLCSMLDFWWPWSLQMCVVYLITHCNLQIYPFFFEWLSDAIHVARVTHLQIVISERECKRCKRAPVRMQSDIRGVSPTSGGACHPSHLPVLLLFPPSPAVREELVSAPIKGKMPILHRVSEQPQSINQPGGKETDIMCVCVCLWLFACLSLCLCVCVCTCAAEAKTHPGVLFSHLWKGASNKGGCNYKCVMWVVFERGRGL